MKYIDQERVWFWSRLGFFPDPPGFSSEKVDLNESERFLKFHSQMYKSGIKWHTSILPSGWIGDNLYDYNETDDILDLLFSACPDICYIPRIKLNAPLGWQQKYPEELCVYYGGPENASEIIKLIGSDKHDILGFDSPSGQYGGKDNRPNVGGLISNQSFASRKWLEAAEDTLRRLIRHIKQGKYAKKIIGYHIGYGVSAECMMWGAWDGKFADYGPAARTRFYEWGLNKYGSEPRMSEVWMQEISGPEFLSLPTPEMRQGKNDSLQKLFRADKEQKIVMDYETFLSEINAEALLNLCRAVKEESGAQTLTGGFYGYTAGLSQAAEAGHVTLQKVLDSEYIDFIAAPNSYLCRAAGQPGAALTPEKSVALNGKVWINECDIRTHLAAPDAGFGRTSNIRETQSVMWRDFARSLSAGANCWWMDLFGGWFDDPEILKTVEQIRQVQYLNSPQRSETCAEVALVLDERCFLHCARKDSWFGKFVLDIIVRVRSLGLPVDIIRYEDIINKKAPAYKLLILPHSFCITPPERFILHEYLNGKTIIWGYASGLLAPELDLNNIFLNTGFKVCDSANKDKLGIQYSLPGGEQFRETLEWKLPVLNVLKEHETTAWGHYNNGSWAVVNKKYHGFNSFYSAISPLPSVVLREIARTAGCNIYIDADCVVEVTCNIITIHTGKKLQKMLYLPQVTSLKDIIDGQEWENIDSLKLNMAAKSSKIFIINKNPENSS
jgi:hypothetical protein